MLKPMIDIPLASFRANYDAENAGQTAGTLASAEFRSETGRQLTFHSFGRPRAAAPPVVRVPPPVVHAPPPPPPVVRAPPPVVHAPPPPPVVHAPPPPAAARAPGCGRPGLPPCPK
jgi:hypothetical protein